jgi:sulfite dehydrogenase
MRNPKKPSALTRRDFIRSAGVLAAAAVGSPSLLANETVMMPFSNGERPLVKYPQKRPLIRTTSRPPQLETPFSVFNEGVYTPNDAFFVRYHLADIPVEIDSDKFQVNIKGSVEKPLTLNLADLKRDFEPVEISAVLQCSGNSRGFTEPRVPGNQLGHGAMGNAKWKGVRLKDVLAKAGLKGTAKQVAFDGLDKAVLEKTPDFSKALDVDHAIDGEVMLAYEMNGEALPMLNGFPLRLVVPGHFGTYWIKHVNNITVLDEPFPGYWMTGTYKAPDNECACIEPGTTAAKMVPIKRYKIRSFITNVTNGAKLKFGETTLLKGIAFDGGYGIREVMISAGGDWRSAELGKDLGKYSFREWQLPFKPSKPGAYELKVRALNRIGQSQPLEGLWNSSGYMRNVVETVRVEVV